MEYNAENTSRARCKALTRDGERCRNPVWRDGDDCYVHRDQASAGNAGSGVSPLDRLQRWWQTTKRRYWIVPVIIAVLGGLVFFSRVWSSMTGEPVLESVRRLVPTQEPTSTAEPTPFTAPAAEGEFLVVVAHFGDQSEARNLDALTVLADGIQQALPDGVEARVVAAGDLQVADRKQALATGKEYGRMCSGDGTRTT